MVGRPAVDELVPVHLHFLGEGRLGKGRFDPLHRRSPCFLHPARNHLDGRRRIGTDREFLHLQGDALPGKKDAGGNAGHEREFGNSLEQDVRAGAVLLNSEFPDDPGYAFDGMKVCGIMARAWKARVDGLQGTLPFVFVS